MHFNFQRSIEDINANKVLFKKKYIVNNKNYVSKKSVMLKEVFGQPTILKALRIIQSLWSQINYIYDFS